MRFPRWAVPVVLRLLSLAGLTSASNGNAQTAPRGLTFGFALSTSSSSHANNLHAPTSLQPPALSLDLDLDFFLQVADLEIKVPIMPLHLLGKKSWNVYNTTNIVKVQQDEAAAKLAEDAEDQRLEDLDAQRRLQILRGEIPTPLAIEDAPPPSPQTQTQTTKRPREQDGGRDRAREGGRDKKRRKRPGENETDFEMRLAQSTQQEHNKERQLILRKEDSNNAPITDDLGNISLFPVPSSSSKTKGIEKNPEVEAALARKKKEYEDQYTMRFSNAAGFKTAVGEKGWYATAGPLGKTMGGEGEDGDGDRDGQGGVGKEVVGRDVWGNEDPRRREREMKRVVENDPLAMMKSGARRVREVEKERRGWREEREREIRELEIADRERERRRRKRRRDDGSEDELEGFRLDKAGDSDRDTRDRGKREDDRERRHRHKHSRRSEHGPSHSHRHREKERERERERDEDDRERRHRHKHRRRSD